MALNFRIMIMGLIASTTVAFAQTDVDLSSTSGITADTPPVYDSYDDPTANLYIENSAYVTSNLKFRGVNIGGNQPGTWNHTKIMMNRGPLQPFIEFDIYGYGPHVAYWQSQSVTVNGVTSATNNIASSGGAMLNGTVGFEVFLNPCRSTSIKFSRSSYHWPGSQLFSHSGDTNGSELQYNAATAGMVSKTKSLLTNNIGFMWRHYEMLASYADTTSMVINPNDTTKTRWPFTWDEYYQIKSPEFPVSEKTTLQAQYGYWRNNGIESTLTLSHALTRQVHLMVTGYNFNSWLWEQDNSRGATVTLKFKLLDLYDPTKLIPTS